MDNLWSDDNTVEFTAEESKAIRALNRWAKTCPNSLMLFGGCGGFLYVLHKRNHGKIVAEIAVQIDHVHADGGQGD